MKKNHILHFALICLLFTACKFEETDLFSDSSAIRLENAKKNCFELLCNSPNGWVMEYFPTTATEGYTFIVKFSTSRQASLAAKNKYLNNVYTKDSCMFDMISDNGPVLTFNTYGDNKGVLHMFANPEDPLGKSTDLDGLGLEGDYEFIVISTSAAEIKLKGKKRGTYIYLRKLEADNSWTGYFDKIDQMHALLFNKATNRLNFLNGNDSLYAYNGDNHIFRIINKTDDPAIAANDYPFIITPTGLRFHSPYVINDASSAQTFNLSTDNAELECAEDQNIRIKADDVNKSFSASLLTWTMDTLTMSPKVKTIYNTIREACKTKFNKPSTGTYVSNVLLALKYSATAKAFGLQLTFKTKTSTLSGEVYMTPETKSNNIFDLAYIAGSGNNNGKNFYTVVAGYADMTALLTRSFTLSSLTAINPQDISFTAVDDNTIKFTILNK